MAGHAVEHDYHIIPPSPRTGENNMMEFFFAKGLDTWGSTLTSDGSVSGGWIILLIGSLFAAFVMYCWWRDVARESAAVRYGMIMFIMQEAMFFVGWFWMFFETGLFHKMRAKWNTDVLENASAYATNIAPGVESVNPWHLPLINTLILLLSGTTVTWAHHALIHGDRKGAKWGLFLTVALGALFMAVQAYEYMELFHYREEGSYPWLSNGAYDSAFFLATGFHGLHVLIGAIFLFVCWARLMKGGLRSDKHFGLEAAAWYWHFVDVVWLFLFAFVYVVFATGV